MRPKALGPRPSARMRFPPAAKLPAEMYLVEGFFWRRARRRSGHLLFWLVVDPRPSVIESPTMRREPTRGCTQASMEERKYQCATDCVVELLMSRLAEETALPNWNQLVVLEPG